MDVSSSKVLGEAKFDLAKCSTTKSFQEKLKLSNCSDDNAYIEIQLKVKEHEHKPQVDTSPSLE